MVNLQFFKDTIPAQGPDKQGTLLTRVDTKQSTACGIIHNPGCSAYSLSHQCKFTVAYQHLAICVVHQIAARHRKPSKQKISWKEWRKILGRSRCNSDNMSWVPTGLRRVSVTVTNSLEYLCQNRIPGPPRYPRMVGRKHEKAGKCRVKQ